MTGGRVERIAEYRAAIPRRFRESYARAMGGKSRKAAVSAFCAECCGYEIREVFFCTSPECPLYPYRPRSRSAQRHSESVPNGAESKKAGEGGELWLKMSKESPRSII